LVLGGDLSVVPLGDLALEDLGDGVDVQVQVVDALEVVGDGDRADDERQVPCLVAAATLGSALDLVLLERGVGAREGDLATDEVGAAGAGAGGGVGQGGTGDGLAVLLAEVVHGVLLGGCALADELAGGAGQALSGTSGSGALSGGGGGGVGAVVGVAAGDESGGADGDDAEDGSGALEVTDHGKAFPVQI